MTEYAGTKLINGTFGVGLSSAGTTITATDGIDTAAGMVAQETYTVGFAAGSAADLVNVTVTTGNGAQTIYDVAAPNTSETNKVSFSAFGLTVTFNSNLTSTTADGVLMGTDSGNSTFQVGAENDSDNRIVVALGDATTQATGLALSTDQLDDAAEAQAFLDTINTAIGTLNNRRGDIGAAQNRLSYAAANLAATIENVTASESVIRDVDMALEMTEFTKNQILLQAGTAMLAQANMAPQLVLALFG